MGACCARWWTPPAVTTPPAGRNSPDGPAWASPPYRPRPGEAVYHIRAAELAVQVAERDLTGPLRELVTAVHAEAAAGWLPGLERAGCAGSARHQQRAGVTGGAVAASATKGR